MTIIEIDEIELVPPSVAVNTLRGFIWSYIHSDVVALAEEAVG